MGTEAGANGGLSSSSSSSSTPTEGKEYEVFLNFRGYDTRYSFTDFLYTYLNDNRVHTYRDKNTLPLGEEIGRELLKAIRESKISIPIFSKNYASSKWCLRELTKMVECMRMGQLIIPIFYDVERSDLKDQDGIYDKALRELQKSERLDDKTIEQWKAALRVVAVLEGVEVKNEADRYQGKIIKEIIVPKVLLSLNKRCMIVPDNLVGMDHHEHEMMRLLDIGSNDVRSVGIHGMVGIGKTTIAKFVYNNLLKHFEHSSFLLDIRETVVQKKGLDDLQKKFLTETLKCPNNIDDVDSGIGMIERVNRDKKVLIVLDDVNDISQFGLLVGKREWYGEGSRIIVTTRNKHILNVLKVDETYEPPFMNSVQSLQLFSIHAFGGMLPQKYYYNISEEVASTAAGLPRALEYTGLSLSGKAFEIWQDKLKKLGGKPYDEVEEELRVTYKALKFEKKQIFLDVACLFNGTDKDDAFYMWNDCKYCTISEFDELSLVSLVKVGDVGDANKHSLASLVKLGDANKLWMHDLFSAFGKNIVCEKKIMGKRSRLWNHEEALGVLKGRMGTEHVEALILCFELESRNRPCFTRKEFKKLKCLRYLQVDGTDLVGDFKDVLFQLKWLHWHGCSPCFQLTNFCLENLVILDLSNSRITEDWGGWRYFKEAKKLKVLQLANCGLRRTLDFSSYETLEKLILRTCQSLLEIDTSIGSMKNLKVLDISYADIRKLPDEIWMLEKLEVMDFTCSVKLMGEIPNNIGTLSSLRFLSFRETEIQSLPTSMWELSCLQILNLGGCKKLQSQQVLPASLRILYVSYIPNLTTLINLQELHFVNLGGCEYAETPRDIASLSKLEKLSEYAEIPGDIAKLSEYAEIPGDIASLSKLEKLTFHSSKIIILPKEIGDLSHLKVLNVQFCDDLQSILGLPSSLVDLSLAYCDSLVGLPDLSNLEHLLKLWLHNCESLTEVHGLGKLVSLTSMNINACEKLANLGDMSNLSKLIALSITNCSGVVRIQGLAKLELLRDLDLHGCENLCQIEGGLAKLKLLRYLDLHGCENLCQIEGGLAKLELLRYLDLHGCENLRQIEGLEALKSLELFDVSGCPLETIPNLPNTPPICEDQICYHGDNS